MPDKIDPAFADQIRQMLDQTPVYRVLRVVEQYSRSRMDDGLTLRELENYRRLADRLHRLALFAKEKSL